MTDQVPGGLAELAKAMVKVQLELPTISLDKQVNYKAVRFEYASLSNIIANTKPILAKHGLSILQFPSADGARVKVDTMVLHESGQFLTGSITAEAGNPKDPKEIGSLISYLRRYSYGSVLGIALDGDYDAELVSEKYIATPEQKIWLRDVLRPMGINEVSIMGEVSAKMFAGNFEMTEDSVVKVLEALRK